MVCVSDDKQENMEPEQLGPTDEEIEEDYNLNLANGKKNLLCGDFPEAVTCLQLACTLQSQRFGDTSHECAECFYYYGKSLLELARVENGVLGNALKGVPETEDSESEKDEEPQFEKTKNLPTNEREQLRQEVEDAMATENEEEGESQEEGEPESEGEKVEKKEEKKEGEEKKKDDAEKGKKDEGETEKGKKKDYTFDTKIVMDYVKKLAEASLPQLDDIPEEETKEGDTPTPSGSCDAVTSSGSNLEKPSASAEDEEDPDDVSNMQLAWEMIELAKLRYLKKPKTDETRLNVAQCHLLLGELGLEQENYPQAIGDYLECLVIHKEVLPSVDRRLAETHYNLGLAYSFDKRYDNSLEHFNAALNVLESRIDFLNEKIDENDRKKEKSEETLVECTEIGEIRTVIPGINAKIEDVMVMKKEDLKLKNLKGESSTGFKPTTDKVCTVIPIRKSTASEEKSEASDISHLVRRKRSMPEDEQSTDKPENGAAINKKLKQETNGNGNGKENEQKEVASNGSNGHSAEKKKEPMTASELKAKNAEAKNAEVAMET